jgi:hypothetical protein
MEEYNKPSSRGNSQMMQMESYYGESRPNNYDIRSYSVSYAQTQIGPKNKDLKFKKGKSISSRSSKSWSIGDDPEFQRKKRVASYKMYSVEGKVKGSFRKSFKWLKNRYWHVVYSLW